MDFFSRFRLLATVAIAVPLLILFAILWSLTDSHQSIETALNTVRQVRQLDEELERVQGLILEAESSQRGFLLTSRTNYLTPHAQATVQLPVVLERLVQMSKPFPDASAQIDILGGLVDERMRLMSRSIEYERLQRHEEALALVNTDRGMEVTEAIRRVVGNLRKAKQGELALGRLDLDERLTKDSIAATILAGFDVVFLVGIIALLQHVIRLQKIATVCAWSKTIRDDDEWISFEVYLQRKFGMAITHGISHEMADRLLEEGRRELVRK